MNKLEEIAKGHLNRWTEKGHETTHYTCPHCRGQVEIRKPEPNMVPPRGFWQKVKECYICHGLTIVKTWPSGNTETE
jgi:hypothetical protein